MILRLRSLLFPWVRYVLIFLVFSGTGIVVCFFVFPPLIAWLIHGVSFEVYFFNTLTQGLVFRLLKGWVFFSLLIGTFFLVIFGKKGPSHPENILSKNIVKELNQESAWANVYANNSLICIETLSGIWHFRLPDPEGKQFYLKPSSSDEEIGEAVAAALLASKKVEVEDNVNYYEKNRVLPLNKERDTLLLQKFSYKNENDMNKDLLVCQVSVQNGVVKMQSLMHEQPKGFLGVFQRKPKIYDAIRVPLNGTPSEIGAALRTALAPKYAKPV